MCEKVENGRGILAGGSGLGIERIETPLECDHPEHVFKMRDSDFREAVSLLLEDRFGCFDSTDNAQVQLRRYLLTQAIACEGDCVLLPAAPPASGKPAQAGGAASVYW